LMQFDFDGFPVRISLMQIIVLAFSASLLLVLGLVLTRTRAGRLWRACSQNNALAQLCGIDTGRVIERPPPAT